MLLSIPLISLLAPLGNVLIPGSGLWRAPYEVPESETFHVEGLSDEVTVYRDEWGIPHIYAKNEADLSFALGYVHAQDRMFQMDMARRSVRGLLSEVVGSYALREDKYNLAMGMEYWARKTLEKTQEMQDNGEIDFLDEWERYVDGINHYNNIHSNELPPEYSILGFSPLDRPWTLLDSMCYSKYMSKMLTWGYSDLYRLINYEALGNEKFDELYKDYMPYQIPIVPDYGDFPDTPQLSSGTSQMSSSLIKTVESFLSDIEQLDSESSLMLLKEQDIIGSNNWVVDGIKSSTGKPILCNDMHLAWNVPGIWYEAHLVAEDTSLNTYGFTLAGVPLPIVAHNQYLAWGLTNTGFDVLDWYYFTEVDDNTYVDDGISKPYETWDYEIPVKGETPEDFSVKVTTHGPVLSDFLGSATPESIDDSDIVIVPRWTANAITYELIAIYEFNHAKNRQEFDEASKYFHNPGQNIVYADVDGNIAIRPTGKVPIRDGNGKFPYDGSNGEGEWTGFIPFEDLPESKNPDQHYLASANQISAGPNYQYFLQNDYSSSYRAKRINELLANAEDGTVGVEKMKEIQLDVKSSAAEAFTPYLISVIEGLNPINRTDLMDDALTQLKNWDYDMDKDISAPSIYRKWRDYYMEETFEDEFEFYEARGQPDMSILEKLTKQVPGSHWFDDIRSGVIEQRDDIILRAFEYAIDFLEDFYDTREVSKWTWDKLHQVTFDHILGLQGFGIGPFESDGSGYTVTPSRVNIDDGTGYARGGASERMIVDFSDLENSISCIPSGQRGISNSEHYSDQLEELFLQGQYHKQYFYDTMDKFAQNVEIESYITMIPASKYQLLIPIMALILIPAFIVGIGLFILIGRSKRGRSKNKVITETTKDDTTEVLKH